MKMNEVAKNGNAEAKVLRRARFAENRGRVQRLKDELSACPHWPMAKELSAVLDETLRDIDALEEKLETKAVVAVVGGSGTGKSSLVNALCGRRDAVKSGPTRPTTRKAAAVVRSVGDADAVMRSLDRDDLDVVPVPDTGLPGAILVDSPDTDSGECESYSEVLDKVLNFADVLVCVFDASNPKRRDNLDRLAHFVAKFPDRHIIIVLNRSDVIDPVRLRDEVVPDFRAHLERCWPGSFDRVFCTATPPDGSPTPQAEFVNDLASLRDFIESAAGTSFFDERAARADMLRRNAEEGIRDAIRRQGDWEGLAGDIREFDGKVSRLAADRYSDVELNGGSGDSADTALLCAVEPRWWGPVGLYLGLSRRFRHFVETPFRLSDLILPIALIRRLKAFFAKEGADESDEDDADARQGGEVVLAGVEGRIIPEYATLADRMVHEFGMDVELLDHRAALDLSALSGALRDAWRTAREAEVKLSARRCSGAFFQLLLNMFFFVPAGYVAYIIGHAFWRENYLPGTFYRHGAVLLLLVWLLASWIVQWRLKVAARAIPGRTARRFAGEDHTAQLLAGVAGEVGRLARLASQAGGRAQSERS